VERTAHFVDGFPGHDHQMKTVIDDLSPGKVFAYPFGVTMQHVHGDPLDALAIPAVFMRYEKWFSPVREFMAVGCGEPGEKAISRIAS
jgi:hypothetical protein